MKTNIKNQNNSELKSRPEQVSTGKSESVGIQPKGEGHTLFVNYNQRLENRKLTTKRVMESLRRWMPKQHRIATVVGNWVWISFNEAPVPQVRQELSQLGFHWNRKRQLWQHPCGNVGNAAQAGSISNNQKGN